MIRLGITGGIGSGKSYVAQMLRKIGVPVYEADAESRRLTNISPIIRERLTNLVGGNVYTGKGDLRKDVLADYAFSSPEALRQVNDIIHPVVRSDFRSWITRQDHPIVAIESAILFEAG
ncbi:MAG: dephospho-CoA kinase, partial [Bacteroidales bacterium]|nr:dephospho-CoA kinase [Bacteroidales bacterium]